jgi:hypothetical protein
MHSRAFYSLPEPKEAGLKWREYEKAREKVSRIEERYNEAGRKAHELEEQIRQEKDEDVRALAASILAGEDDPAARSGKLEGLAEKLREHRRQMEALAQTLPVAEEELRQVVYEHQHRWKDEADAALEKTIAEERKAYAKAQEMISGPRAKRLYLEALTKWVRYPAPTFGADVDIQIPTAMQPLAASVEQAEQRMQERRYNERLQQQQEGAA